MYNNNDIIHDGTPSHTTTVNIWHFYTKLYDVTLHKTHLFFWNLYSLRFEEKINKASCSLFTTTVACIPNFVLKWNNGGRGRGGILAMEHVVFIEQYECDYKDDILNI